MDAHGMPVRFLGTAAATEDCGIEVRLIEGFRAEDLLTDWGCDADTTIPRLSMRE